MSWRGSARSCLDNHRRVGCRRGRTSPPIAGPSRIVSVSRSSPLPGVSSEAGSRSRWRAQFLVPRRTGTQGLADTVFKILFLSPGCPQVLGGCPRNPLSIHGFSTAVSTAVQPLLWSAGHSIRSPRGLTETFQAARSLVSEGSSLNSRDNPSEGPHDLESAKRHTSGSPGHLGLGGPRRPAERLLVESEQCPDHLSRGDDRQWRHGDGLAALAGSRGAVMDRPTTRPTCAVPR